MRRAALTASFFLLLLPLPSARAETPRALLGIDCLQRDGLAPIAGMKVGLITNHTGVDSRARTTIDILAESDKLDLVRLFSPEHGLRGELDQSNIDDSVDTKTGLPVVSLHGERRQPSAEHLADLDALVFDIQDIGCRFYTYISTMKLAMQAASKAKIRFVVLDRPNPLGGRMVRGPMRDDVDDTFVACHDLPVVHGMTIGEMARLFAADLAIDIKLDIVKVENWRRSQTWDQTGLVWKDPSPNMRRLSAALLYPGVGLLETTNLSVGRGTDTPFELLGAPWIDPTGFAAELNKQALPGVRAVPRWFTPASGPHAHKACGGVDLLITRFDKVEPIEIGTTLAATLHRLYPDDWQTKRLPRLLVSRKVQKAILSDKNPAALKDSTEEGVGEFLKRREKALLYN